MNSADRNRQEYETLNLLALSPLGEIMAGPSFD